MEIRRDRYLERLIAHKGNGRVKIVTGIRRCGKSYLLFQLFKRHLIETGVKLNHIIEIQLEDRSNKELRNPDVCLAFIKKQIKDQKPYYLLIDEVQLMDEFEDVLNSCLHIQNLDTYVTGSNSKFLSKDIIAFKSVDITGLLHDLRRAHTAGGRGAGCIPEKAHTKDNVVIFRREISQCGSNPEYGTISACQAPRSFRTLYR